MICCPLAYGSSLTQFYPPYLVQTFGFWVTCKVKIMWLCHVWGWQPPHTASHIHIRHVQSDWAHWYAVHMHTISALHSYTHPISWLRFWGSGSLVESKWCDYVIFEANSHLKLLPTSILDVQSDWAHWYAILGHTVSPLHRYSPYLGQILGFWVTCGVKMMWLCHGWGWQPPQTASLSHIRLIQSNWAHWYAVHRHTVAALNSFTHPAWIRFWGERSHRWSQNYA
jgi:hypothetical protein